MSVENSRRIRAAMAVCCVVAVLAGCGNGLKELEQTPRQDAVVIAGVKAALVRDPQLDAAAIQVSIVDGQLVLEGYVDSPGQSEASAETARQNATGMTVLNRLEVR